MRIAGSWLDVNWYSPASIAKSLNHKHWLNNPKIFEEWKTFCNSYYNKFATGEYIHSPCKLPELYIEGE